MLPFWVLVKKKRKGTIAVFAGWRPTFRWCAGPQRTAGRGVRRGSYPASSEYFNDRCDGDVESPLRNYTIFLPRRIEAGERGTKVRRYFQVGMAPGVDWYANSLL